MALPADVLDRQQQRRKTTFATSEKIQAKQRCKTAKVGVLAKVKSGLSH
jgi:hypothetical protein